MRAERHEVEETVGFHVVGKIVEGFDVSFNKVGKADGLREKDGEDEGTRVTEYVLSGEAVDFDFEGVAVGLSFLVLAPFNDPLSRL